MSVRSRRQTPTWPFLMVLVSLFVLSLTAPRKWEKIARSKPLVSSAKFSRPAAGMWRPDSASIPFGAQSASATGVDSAPGASMAIDVGAGDAFGETASEPTLAPAQTAHAAPAREVAPAMPVASERANDVVPIVRSTDLGAAMAKLAPPPSLLGDEGQLSLRVPADLSPALVARREKSTGPEMFGPKSDVLRIAPGVRQPAADRTTMSVAPAAETPATETRAPSLAAPTLAEPSPAMIEPPVAREIVADDSLEEPVVPAFVWAEPVQLLTRLEELTAIEGAHAWSYEVIALIHELLGTAGPHTPEGAEILSRLAAVADKSSSVAARLAISDAAQFQRVAYALKRRMDVWLPLASLPQRDAGELALVLPDPDRLALSLHEVNAVTQDAAGSGWREYLLFDSLQKLADGRGGSDAAATRLLAQRVLARLAASRLSKSQQKFVADETLAHLSAELRCWAAEPIDSESLLAHVEAYEQAGGGSNSRLLAADLQRLAWSPSAQLQDYGRSLEQRYRNANVRVVVSEELLSRMMPPQEPRNEIVRETILGAPTRGRSRTETDITAKLIPDPHRLRFLVQAHGRVSARTNSHSGPATMSSMSNSTFEAAREMEMTLEGLQAREMVVSAKSSARLRDVSTDLDVIPIVGSLVNGYARQQYTEKRSAAERELERIVAQKAINNIARQSSERVAETNSKLQAHLLTPLERLQIEPTMIETQTTDDRMTVRLRIAGDDQLGAHTPRPRAPGASLLSAQLHESAVNNFLSRLKLGGRLISERKIYEQLASTFNVPASLLPSDLHDNVLIQLAEEDPIQVRFADGQITIELRVEELHAEEQVFRNFVVRANYAPDPASGTGELARQGTVQLIGRHLRPKAQIALRGMFSKTFNKDRRLAVLPQKLLDDPRMTGIQVTQFAVADGWIGIALADTRPVQANIATGKTAAKSTR